MNITQYLRDRQYGVKGLGKKPKQKVIEDFVEERLTESYINKPCSVSGHCRSTFIMDFSPDGTKVASTHGDHTVRVSDLQTGKCLRTLQGHPRTPWCLAYHPSSNHILASGCLGGQVRIWDLYGCGCEVWQMENNKVIAALTFHPTDHVLVIAAGHTMYFWDWSKPEPFAQCSTTHEYERIRWVKFDSIGHYLYTGICNNTTIHRDNVPDVLANTRQQSSDTSTPMEPEEATGTTTTTSMYNNLVDCYQQYQRNTLMTHRTPRTGSAMAGNRPRHMTTRPGQATRSESSSTVSRSVAASARSSAASSSERTSGRRCTCPGPAMTSRRSWRPRQRWQNASEQTEICLQCTPSTTTSNNPTANSDQGLLNAQSDPFFPLDPGTASTVDRTVSDEQASGALPALSSVWPGIPTSEPVPHPIGYSLTRSRGVSDFSSLQSDVTSSLSSCIPRRPSAATTTSLSASSSSHSVDTTDTDVSSGTRPEEDNDEDEMPRLQEMPEWMFGSYPVESVPDFTRMPSSGISGRNSELGFQEVDEPIISVWEEMDSPESPSSDVGDSPTLPAHSDILHLVDGVNTNTDTANEYILNDAAATTTTTRESILPTHEPHVTARTTSSSLPVSTTQVGSSSNRTDSHHSQYHGSHSQGSTKPVFVSSSPQSKPFSSIRDRLQSTVALCSVTSSAGSSKMASSLHDGTIPVVTVISACDTTVCSTTAQSASNANLNASISCNRPFSRWNQNLLNPLRTQSSTEPSTVPVTQASMSTVTSDPMLVTNSLFGNRDPVNQPEGECVNLVNIAALGQLGASATDSVNLPSVALNDHISVTESGSSNRVNNETGRNRTHLFDHVLRSCPNSFHDSDLRRSSFEQPSDRNSSPNVAGLAINMQHNSTSSASHSRDQASSDTENELSSHLTQSGAYFMPIPDNPLRTHSSSSSTRSMSSNEANSEARIARQGTSSTDSSAGQSSRSNSRTHGQENNVEVVIDQNDNYTARTVRYPANTIRNERDPMQILQEISIRNNDGNNNSIHILQPNVQPTVSHDLSSSVTLSTPVTRQSEVSTIRRSEGQPVGDSHQHYVALRNNFVSMTDQIEREMSALNRRINALRDSFNESLVALHHDRQRYSQFGNAALSEVNGSLSTGSGVMSDSLDALEMGPRLGTEFDTMNSGDDDSDLEGSPGGPSTTASSFTQPPTLLETSLRSHNRNRQLEPGYYHRSGMLDAEVPLRAPSTSRPQLPGPSNTSNWRLLHRHFLHPHYSSNILDEAINRPNNAIQSAISRAIAGAFVGTAMANNMINQTHRIQGWDFSKCSLPDLSNCDENVIVLHCKLHNSASCDIACNDTMLATFVPSPQGFPEDNILAVYSLQANNRGQCLYTKSFGPNAISISISPSNQYVLVGLAAKRLSWVFTSKQLVAQIFKLEKEFEGESSMRHVRDVKHSCNLDVRTHVSGNSARWLPQSGQGLVYGTNRGDLQLCTPGTAIVTDKPVSFNPTLQSRNIVNRYRYLMSDSPSWAQFNNPHRVSASTQTQGQAGEVSQSAGTQTDLEGNHTSMLV